MKFYDREEEMEALEKAFSLTRSRSSLIIVTGRRRIGKTRLVREFFSRKNIPYLDFFVSVKEESLLLEDFQDEIEEKLGYSPKFENFEDLLNFLFKTQDKLAIFFDEFQNFLKINPSIIHDLQKFWDRYKEEKRFFVILSGSYIGMMRKVFLLRKSPLYGRADLYINLKPLRPSTVFQMLNDLGVKDLEEKIKFYGIFGGVPKYYEYLELFRERTFFDFLEQMLKFSSILQNEGEALLIEEFGRAHKIYFSILEAIASSRNTLVEIANAISQKPTTIPKYLKALEEYFNLISKENPVLEKKTKKSRYIINDYFLNFWFTFIRKNQNLVETGNYEALMRKIEGNFSNYFGRVFERIVKDILLELNQRKVIEFDEIGPQWGRSKKGSYEIDLVATKGNKALFIEVKWRDNVNGIALFKELKEKADLTKWKGEREFLIIAKSFKKRAPDALCWDLKDLEGLMNS
ncbi:hypothetical protein PAP_09775 [Palaeococcus pacificus DY20341]|uniref:ATPase n=1 Tax=Palaeococcus pacificus DY20341 TaxID=1343739 RepID=A0A075LUD5_9EURY|nr:ATP-binding protein [Palaeococcus pacificus]AIF70330.1 hypothetical protein PAP_09775 [Palaeococcus pacificus DY20341]